MLAGLHEFIKRENDAGSISRQEAVSMVPPLFLDVQPQHYVRTLSVSASNAARTAAVTALLCIHPLPTLHYAIPCIYERVRCLPCSSPLCTDATTTRLALVSWGAGTDQGQVLLGRHTHSNNPPYAPPTTITSRSPPSLARSNTAAAPL